MEKTEAKASSQSGAGGGGAGGLRSETGCETAMGMWGRGEEGTGVSAGSTIGPLKGTICAGENLRSETRKKLCCL